MCKATDLFAISKMAQFVYYSQSKALPERACLNVFSQASFIICRIPSNVLRKSALQHRLTRLPNQARSRELAQPHTDSILPLLKMDIFRTDSSDQGLDMHVCGDHV